jgi:glycerol-3-phosphate dehydrogenase (NAD(P)+)
VQDYRIYRKLQDKRENKIERIGFGRRKMSVITFICAGQMNSAITFPAFENGHEVRLVGSPLDGEIIDGLRKDNYHITLKRTLHDGIKYYKYEELPEALEGADLLVGGVSSFGLDWFCDEILPVIPEEIPLITVTKGMVDREDGTLVPYPMIFEERQPKGKHINFNAIGGPCTSYELADHDPSHVSFCGKDMKTLEYIRSLLQTDYYLISLSTDVVGVECSVAMKNAYALGVSLAVGLAEKRDGRIGALHFNSQAALFEQGVREMMLLMDIVGGRRENNLVGIGDLYVTIYGGRTRKIGTLLGRGYSFEKAMEELSGVTLESIVIATRTARAVRRLAERGIVSLDDFPLMMHVDEIINNGAEVDIPWKKFTVVQE